MLPPPLLFLIHVCLSESGGKEPGGQCGAACLGSDSYIRIRRWDAEEYEGEKD